MELLNLFNTVFIIASNIVKLLIDLPFYLFVIIINVFQAFVSSISRTRKHLGPEDKILVTGTSSGIGRHAVYKLVKLFPEAVYILWSKSEAGLEETARNCRKFGAKNVHTFVVDVSKREEIIKNAALVRETVGNVNILWNNAGTVSYSTFLNGDPEHDEYVIKVNLLSNMWTIREFLPGMVAEGKGQIVTTSSAFSFYRWSHASTYVSSKYGQRGFLDSLKLELSLHPGKPDIKFSTFYPAFLSTPLTHHVSYEPRYDVDGVRPMKLEQVAEQIVDGILKEKEEIKMPMCLVSMLDVAYRILPFKCFEYLDKNVYRNLNDSNFSGLTGSKNSKHSNDKRTYVSHSG